jgi:hypothetical protein
LRYFRIVSSMFVDFMIGETWGKAAASRFKKLANPHMSTPERGFMRPAPLSTLSLLIIR